MKKVILLAAISTIALGGAAFAQGSQIKNDGKLNGAESTPNTQTPSKTTPAPTMGAPKGTTGSGMEAKTTSDPRDSNAKAKPGDKRLEDAKQKGN